MFLQFRSACFLMVMAGACLPLSATSVFIDTSGLSGVTGNLAFDFTDGGPPSNSVSVQNFTSNGTLGSHSITGTVTGTLPGTITLSDTTVFNEYLAGFTFGTTISFTLTATQNAPGGGS